MRLSSSGSRAWPERRKLTELMFLPFLVLYPAIAYPSVSQITGSEFLEKSQFIFVGTVIERESFWSEDRRFILTRHIFAVEEPLKGAPGDRVEIVEYGGRADGITLQLSHGASYSRGAEYVVFTYRDSSGRQRTLAGPLGQLPVIRQDGGERLIRLHPSHPLAEVLAPPEKALFRDLYDFCGQLRSALEAFSHEEN